ncbi:ABC transporter ATP-binding protein [Actinospica durhamensis]|uniref:ABC transporter ATP-binding protein n=1 Tax=Actinospica durhamensis TaxID=1508375 RepID=A0A941IPL7_9ACTN|nr:ABC transporter ATP-binding protein [Actinospica durhamensis]MBR7836685.1 ABC transporter ATP-binding protein [Actinospica durhamensis]
MTAAVDAVEGIGEDPASEGDAGSGESEREQADPLFGTGYKFSAGWNRHDEEFADMSLGTLARRLPEVMGLCLRLSWRTDARAVVMLLACQIANGVLTAFGLLATQRVLVSLLAEGPTPGRVRAAIPSLLVVGAAAMCAALLGVAGKAASGALRPKVARLAYRELLQRAVRVELLRFQQPEFKDLIAAAQFGAGWAEYMLEQISALITSAAGIAAAAGVLAALKWQLVPLLILAVVPDGVNTLVVTRRRNASRLKWLSKVRQQTRLTTLMVDQDPAEEVRLHGVDKLLLAHHDRLSEDNEAEQARLAVYAAKASLVSRAISGTTTAVIYLVLGYLTWRGQIPLATAGTAVFAIGKGTSQLAGMVTAMNSTVEYGLYLVDLADAIEQAEQAQIPDDAPAPAGPPQLIEARGLRFRYPNKDSAAIDGIDLTIRAGEVVAFVGENGSGKTTLAKLLTGLYLPTEGQLLWDGVPLGELSRPAAATHVGLLPQSFEHWPFTARWNIAVGRPEVEHDDAAVREAAARGGADTVIDELKQGLDTLIASEFFGGVNLSGGQWQKIALARSFLRDAPVLLLDEPTASLDPKAEQKAFETVMTLAEGRTVILITHRMNSVRHAHRIVVLDHGRIIEQGSHAELMRARGHYAELYRLQAEAFSLPEDER